MYLYRTAIQQLSIYKIFILDIHHGNFIAWYDISAQYLGATQDETMAVEISQHQFSICQAANGQFCDIYAPLQPLANPPSCIKALYTRNWATITTRCSLQIRETQSISLPSQITPNVWILTTAPSAVTNLITLICPGENTTFITVKKPIHVLQLPPACSAISAHFNLAPCYEHPALRVNISLNMANLNMANIWSLDFCIWQHLKDHRNEIQLHHLSSIPSVPIAKLYKQMVSGIKPIIPFTSCEEWTGDTVSIWTLFPHIGVYVMAIRSLIPAELGIFCCYFICCQPARLAHQPIQPMYYVIYYCGWWCRGNTHLQIWWQGQTAHKASWESWPAYGVSIYTHGEMTEAADAVISSSCMWIIGIHFQNPGNT